MLERLLLLGLSTLVAAQAAVGQPTNTCSGADLDGSDTLPISSFAAGATNTFNPNGSGCSSVSNGVDAVACFVPQNNCDMRTVCDGGIDSVGHNLYDLGVGGACSDISSGTSCAASDFDLMATIQVSLTAGRTYCIVCDHWITGSGAVGFSVSAANGTDCGALPVSLQSFQISK